MSRDDEDKARPTETPETLAGRVAGPERYDAGGRDRHDLPSEDHAGFGNRDEHPAPTAWDREEAGRGPATAGPAMPHPAGGGEVAPPDDPAGTGPSTAGPAMPHYASEVGYLDRGVDDAEADLAEATRYSGLEGTDPRPEDGRAGATNTQGKTTVLADRRPR